MYGVFVFCLTPDDLYYIIVDPFLTAVKLGMDHHPLLVFEEHPGIDTTHWLADLPVMSCRKHKLGPKPSEFPPCLESSDLLRHSSPPRTYS